MPKLSQNEWYARKATKDISNMLDLPEAVVRSVIDALALHLLDELREKGMNTDEAETVEHITDVFSSFPSIPFILT